MWGNNYGHYHRGGFGGYFANQNFQLPGQGNTQSARNTGSAVGSNNPQPGGSTQGQGRGSVMNVPYNPQRHWQHKSPRNSSFTTLVPVPSVTRALFKFRPTAPEFTPTSSSSQTSLPEQNHNTFPGAMGNIPANFLEPPQIHHQHTNYAPIPHSRSNINGTGNFLNHTAPALHNSHQHLKYVPTPQPTPQPIINPPVPAPQHLPTSYIPEKVDFDHPNGEPENNSVDTVLYAKLWNNPKTYPIKGANPNNGFLPSGLRLLKMIEEGDLYDKEKETRKLVLRRTRSTPIVRDKRMRGRKWLVTREGWVLEEDITGLEDGWERLSLNSEGEAVNAGSVIEASSSNSNNSPESLVFTDPSNSSTESPNNSDSPTSTTSHTSSSPNTSESPNTITDSPKTCVTSAHSSKPSISESNTSLEIIDRNTVPPPGIAFENASSATETDVLADAVRSSSGAAMLVGAIYGMGGGFGLGIEMVKGRGGRMGGGREDGGVPGPDTGRRGTYVVPSGFRDDDGGSDTALNQAPTLQEQSPNPNTIPPASQPFETTTKNIPDTDLPPTAPFPPLPIIIVIPPTPPTTPPPPPLPDSPLLDRSHLRPPPHHCELRRWLRIQLQNNRFSGPLSLQALMPTYQEDVDREFDEEVERDRKKRKELRKLLTCLLVI